MTAKETIRAKLFKLRLRARQTGQVRLPASAVALWTEAGIHFLLSAVLSGAVLLGDMAISLERCQAQGEEFGHGFEREVMYLTVHSVLHLLGYDHVDEAEMKRQMRAREEMIMSGLGV